jgi:hypothetical protein
MSLLWERRAAHNEPLFREVKENIADLEERFGPTGEPVFVCECSNVGCSARLAVDAPIYRRMREQPRLFLVRAGPEDPQSEQVVEIQRDFLIVEKTGAAGEVAEETQP